jgi:ubiquinone/menaquinone biosynthesis C-methylase UbiE
MDRDCGCGNPTEHVRSGEDVLDLNSGTGKACYVMEQMVGPQGRMAGVDFKDDMLSLPKRHQPAVAAVMG